MYVAEKYVKWEDLEFECDVLPFPAVVPKEMFPGCSGCMLVFDTVEALLDMFPDSEWTEIKLKQNTRKED